MGKRRHPINSGCRSSYLLLLGIIFHLVKNHVRHSLQVNLGVVSTEL